jgi:hypothetical protein
MYYKLRRGIVYFSQKTWKLVHYCPEGLPVITIVTVLIVALALQFILTTNVVFVLTKFTLSHRCCCAWTLLGSVGLMFTTGPTGP